MYILWRALSAISLFAFSFSMMITSAMADPMTILTIASISTTLAGTAMAASGTIAAGKAAQQAAGCRQGRTGCGPARGVPIKTQEEVGPFRTSGQTGGFGIST
jgi:hypothetical protein